MASETSKGGITPMSSITAMEMLEEMDDMDFKVGDGGVSGSSKKIPYETLDMDQDDRGSLDI